jgi:hypothetical protein
MTMRWTTLGVLLALGSAPALGNDTTAVLTTGGLEFVTNPDIVMESEDLYLSTDEIRVTYRFRNDGESDHNILVAFPMPDIVADAYTPTAYPDGPPDNLFQFETLFNGEPVDAELHEYAYAAGVDRTKLIKQMGLPLVPFLQDAGSVADALDAEDRDLLLHLGLLTVDEFDAGNGWETHYLPAWSYRATYTWEGNFPAGETVTVEHRYKPSVGGTVAFSGLAEPSAEYDPQAPYKKYCLDDDIRAAVRKTLADPADPYSAPFTESWLSYILTTGGNWGFGAIETFRLVVDKGSTDNLVSFCGDNIRNIGPTTFEMTATDFWPERELDILILDRRDP